MQDGLPFWKDPKFHHMLCLISDWQAEAFGITRMQKIRMKEAVSLGIAPFKTKKVAKKAFLLFIAWMREQALCDDPCEMNDEEEVESTA
jgi:hypothetical protein